MVIPAIALIDFTGIHAIEIKNHNLMFSLNFYYKKQKKFIVFKKGFVKSLNISPMWKFLMVREWCQSDSQFR